MGRAFDHLAEARGIHRPKGDRITSPAVQATGMKLELPKEIRAQGGDDQHLAVLHRQQLRQKSQEGISGGGH